MVGWPHILPETVWVCSHCPSLIINNSPFTLKMPIVLDKLYGNSINMYLRLSMCKVWTLDFSQKLLSVSSTHFSKRHYNSTQYFKNVASTVSSMPKMYSRSVHFSPLPPSLSESLSALTCVTKSAPTSPPCLHSCLRLPPPQSILQKAARVIFWGVFCFGLVFFINLFILFIYFWLRWVFVAACGLSLVAASGG